jgi:beta-N-acetylhexosaminidase
MRPLPVTPVLLLLLIALFSRCHGKDSGSPSNTEPDPIAAAEDQAADGQAADGRAEKDLAAKRAAAGIAAAFTDRQLAAQVIISGIDGKGHLTQDMKILLAECPAGGIMLFRYNLDTGNDAIQNLIAETAALVASGTIAEIDQTAIAVPPFIAVDHEGGPINRFRSGVANLPSAVSYWEMTQNDGSNMPIEKINTDSFNAGTAIKRLGVNMNLAPVVEYLNEDNADFLNDRSYGPNPAFAAKAAGAFVAGMEKAGILCVVKHFPGSAGADPHHFPSVLQGDKAAIDKLVFPFAALIRENRMRALMVSHSLVPALDNKIASLSPAIMGVWLRQEMGFEGIIVSDDFSMASARGPAFARSPASASSTAIAGKSEDHLRPETAAVLSLAAGADMVLVWPPDLRRTHRAIMTALKDGTLSRERLEEAAERIIFEKIRMGIVTNE